MIGFPSFLGRIHVAPIDTARGATELYAVGKVVVRGAGVAVTTRLNVVVLAKGLPVTVIGKVPVGVVPLVAIVSVIEQLGVQETGENVDVVPAGSPEAAKLTICAGPETSVAVIVFVPAEPCPTVMAPELASE